MLRGEEEQPSNENTLFTRHYCPSQYAYHTYLYWAHSLSYCRYIHSNSNHDQYCRDSLRFSYLGCSIVKKTWNNLQRIQSSKEISDARPVTVMRREKECHITIDKFQRSKVAKAIRDILDFQEEEETTVRISLQKS